MDNHPDFGLWDKHPVCGMFATALVTGRRVSAIKKEFKKRYGLCDKWQGRSCVAWNINAIIRSGRKPKQFELKKRRTLRKWVEWEADKKSRYFLATRDHIVLYKAGKVYDQMGIRKLENHFSKNQVVVSAWRV